MIYDVKDFGAVGDGATLNTSCIQAAIDAAHKTGGTVLIEGGVYKSGSVALKSNVNLCIEEGATLLAHTRALTDSHRRA